MLNRIDLSRDIHFHTNTTIDTLDYSGTGLNRGSKVVFAAYGDIVRDLCIEVPGEFFSIQNFEKPKLVLPGIICIQTKAFSNYANAEKEMSELNEQLRSATGLLRQCPFIIVCDDAVFASDKLNNFLWITFTRSNPSYDIYGINSFYSYKHWGCDAVIIDARIKPHHAPVLEKDAATEKKIERIFNKGGSLYGVLK
jgi:4-hydroxy-3-polyprenylbenzoate decarboxylase